jgi:hypothetical protein
MKILFIPERLVVQKSCVSDMLAVYALPVHAHLVCSARLEFEAKQKRKHGREEDTVEET